jgi:hypothetical protein
VTHSGLIPTNLNSPCQPYIVLRGDIMPSFPSVLYAGFVQPFSLTLSQPTKMLRIDLSCTDSAINFLPNTFYFDSYDIISQWGQISVTSLVSDTNNIYLNLTHEESGNFSFYRPNLPWPITIITNHVEYVIV